MTDAPLPSDAADELASAYLDDELTAAERSRVEADPELLARVDALARVRAALGAPVAPDPRRREAALSAALAVAAEPGGVLGPTGAEPGRGEPVAVLSSRRRPPALRRRYLAAAAAAAVAALAVPLLSQLGGDDDEADTASVALDAEAFEDDLAARDEDGAMAEGPAPMAGAEDNATFAPTGAPADLGAFDDLEALSRAVAGHPKVASGPTTSDATGAEALTSTTLAGACAGRLDLPADVEVLLDGTATLAGDAVVVVVHRTPGTGARLLVATLDGCRTITDRPL